jgi:Fic family protein
MELDGIGGIFQPPAMLPPRISLTQDILRLISAVDEFRGEWRALDGLGPEKLQSLRRIATIESAGSSTRIEGARLSDRDVEALLRGVGSASFQTRDEQEVGGYAYVTETIQAAWQELCLTEGILLQLHRDLLRYSEKDERHRGGWKTHPNHVAAFDAEGREIGIVFQTTSPFDTPRAMEELLAWHLKEEDQPSLHPLLRIAVFVVVFLAIHPFQDGNGRLSRIITNLLLLRAGYGHAAYSSLESVIEHNKEAYYLALRRTQTSLATGTPDWEPWLMFFLRSMNSQVERLRERISKLTASPAPRSGSALSPLAEKLHALLHERGTLTVAEAATLTGASRNTLKDKFRELVENGSATLHGKGRGAHYRKMH